MDGFGVGVQEINALHELEHHTLEVNFTWNAIPELMIGCQCCQIKLHWLTDEGNHCFVFEWCLNEIQQRWMPEFG